MAKNNTKINLNASSKMFFFTSLLLCKLCLLFANIFTNKEIISSVTWNNFIRAIHLRSYHAQQISPSWSKRKAQKRLYFLRKRNKVRIWSRVTVNFYKRAIESILNGKITNWHGWSQPRQNGSTAGDSKHQNISGVGESFIVHKTFMEHRNKTALQHSPKKL